MKLKPFFSEIRYFTRSRSCGSFGKTYFHHTFHPGFSDTFSLHRSHFPQCPAALLCPGGPAPLRVFMSFEFDSSLPLETPARYIHAGTRPACSHSTKVLRSFLASNGRMEPTSCRGFQNKGLEERILGFVASQRGAFGLLKFYFFFLYF